MNARTRSSDWWWALVTAGAAVMVMFSLPPETGRFAWPVGVALLVCAGATLAWRRRWPVATMLAATGLSYVYLVLDYPGSAEIPVQMMALYSAAMRGERRPALGVFVLIVLANVGYRLVLQDDQVVLVAISIVPLALALALGDGAHIRQRLHEQTQAQLQTLEAQRAADARAAVAEERAQIARELHDVLAHTITAITVQAAAAADGLPEGEERDRLRHMRRTANDAREQLRTTLAVLRTDDDGSAVPTLHDLQALAQPAEAAGVAVTIRHVGRTRPLPPAAELAGFRIAQEALTNVVRHADATTVDLTVTYAADTFRVQVTNDTQVPVASSTLREGFGIIGMRERVHAVGGTLRIGPTAHGFTVEAVLPAPPAPTTDEQKVATT